MNARSEPRRDEPKSDDQKGNACSSWPPASGAEKRNGRKAGIRAHQLGVADLAAGAGAGRHLIRRV
jgi:hypothetical protein